MFEEIFDVKRGRNLLDVFISPADDEGLLKDIERSKPSEDNRFSLSLKSIKNLLFVGSR